MLERLKEIILNYTEADAQSITCDTAIRDLGLNSYDFINVIAACEEEFGIEIPDRDIGGMETVGDVLEYIETSKV